MADTNSSLLLQINGDSSGGTGAVREIAQEIGGLPAEAKAAADQMSAAFKGASTALEGVSSGAVTAQGKVVDLRTVVSQQADKPGLVGGLIHDLDVAIPKVQQLDAEILKTQSDASKGTGGNPLGSITGALNTGAGPAGKLGTALADTDALLAKLEAQEISTAASTATVAAEMGGAAVATGGFGASLLAAVDAAAPYLVAATLVGEGIAWLADQWGKATLAAEVNAAKQDTIDRAYKVSGGAVMSYADAVKYLDETYGHLNPQLDHAADALERVKIAAGKGPIASLAESTEQLARSQQHVKDALQFDLSTMGGYEGLEKGLALLRQDTAASDAAFKEWSKNLGLSSVTLDVLKEQVKAETDAQKTATDVTKKHNEELKKQHDAAKKAGDAQRELYANLGSSMSDLSGAQVEAIKYYKDQGASVQQIAKALGVYEQQVKQVEAAEKDLEKAQVEGAKNAIKAKSEEIRVAAASIEAIGKIGQAAVAQDVANARTSELAIKHNIDAEKSMRQEHTTWLLKQSGSMYAQQRTQLDTWINDQEGKLDYSVEGWQTAYDQIHQVASDRLEDIATAEATALAKMHQQELGWSQEFNVILGSLPQHMIGALTGGGGVEGAMKATLSSVGTDIGGKLFVAGGPLNKLGGKMTQGITKMFGDSVGTAFGAALPGIGEALGSLLPLAMKGISALMHIGGPSQQELSGRTAEMQFQASLGSNLAESQAALQQQYIATGMSATAAADRAQQDFLSMFAAEKQGGDAVKKVVDGINASLKEQQGIISGTDPLMQKYGLSWKDLGEDAKKAHIAQELKDAQAETKKLIGMGLDQSQVYDHMNKVYGQYVRDVLDSGQPIEASMIPALQRLKDMGTLVDATGEAISDVDWAKLVQGAEAAAAGVQAALGGIRPPQIGTGIYVPPVGATPSDLSGDDNPLGTPSFYNAPLSNVTKPGYALLHPGDVVGKPDLSSLHAVAETVNGSGGGGIPRVQAMSVPTSFTLHIVIPPGTDVQDPEKLAGGMLTALRNDFIGVRTAIENIADARINSAIQVS